MEPRLDGRAMGRSGLREGRPGALLVRIGVAHRNRRAGALPRSGQLSLSSPAGAPACSPGCQPGVAQLWPAPPREGLNRPSRLDSSVRITRPRPASALVRSTAAGRATHPTGDLSARLRLGRDDTDFAFVIERPQRLERSRASSAAERFRRPELPRASPNANPDRSRIP